MSATVKCWRPYRHTTASQQREKMVHARALPCWCIYDTIRWTHHGRWHTLWWYRNYILSSCMCCVLFLYKRISFERYGGKERRTFDSRGQKGRVHSQWSAFRFVLGNQKEEDGKGQHNSIYTGDKSGTRGMSGNIFLPIVWLFREFPELICTLYLSFIISNEYHSSNYYRFIYKMLWVKFIFRSARSIIVGCQLWVVLRHISNYIFFLYFNSWMIR